VADLLLGSSVTRGPVPLERDTHGLGVGLASHRPYGLAVVQGARSVPSEQTFWVEHIWWFLDTMRPASQVDRRTARSPLIAKYVERLLDKKSGSTSDDAP
jgi:hypothetical protein